MNNSYMLYAQKEKGKNNSFRNLWFFLKEGWQFKHFFVICMILYPFPEIVGSYIGTRLPAMLVEGIESGTALDQLLIKIGLVGLGFIFCILAANILSNARYVNRRFFHNYLTKRFLNKIEDIDYEVLEHSSYQEIYSNAWTSANNGRGFQEGSELVSIVINCILGIGLYGWILGSRNLILLVLVLICVGVNLYLLSIARKVHKKYFGKISKYAKGEVYISDITMDSAYGKDIRIYNMLDFILKKYDQNLKNIGGLYGKIHNWYLFRNLSGAFLAFARDGAAYLFLIHEMIEGNISAAEFVFLLGVIANLAQYFENFLRMLMSWNTLDASAGYFRQFLEIGSSWRTVPVIPEEKWKEIKEHGIEVVLQDVSYTYEGAKEPTIKHLNLTIRQGEKLALIGLNGAGKTTLVKLICGFYTPEEGRILINGIERSQFTKKEYTSLMSVMFQDAQFLPVSLDENLTSYSHFDRERLNQALHQAGFWERYQEVPNQGKAKLIKKLEQNAVDFSGGEKQKLIFARAIYKDSSFVILDEPTAALDPIAENELYQNFKEAIGARTALYISHRLSSTRFCDRIILLEQGQIAEEGTHAELMEQGGKYKELYEMQSQYYKEEALKDAKQRMMQEGEDLA